MQQSHRLMSARSFNRRDFLAGVAACGAAGFASADPTPEIAAQTPVPAGGAFAPFSERIGELLAFAPRSQLSDDDQRLFLYADLEQQLASVGVAPPSTLDDFLGRSPSVGSAVALLPVFYSIPGLTPWTDVDAEAVFGFFPLSAGRVLYISDPPINMTIFAGGIDTVRIREVLLASGYEEVEQATGGSYLTIGNDDASPSSPGGELVAGTMNHAVLGDDLVIFTQQQAIMQQITQVMAEAAPSMAEQEGWPELMTTFADDVVGLVAMPPEAVLPPGGGNDSPLEQVAMGVRAGSVDQEFFIEVAAEDEGTSVPGPESSDDLPEKPARVQVRLRYVDETTAAREAEAIPDRWLVWRTSNGQPLTEVMMIEKAQVSDRDPTVAEIDFQVVDPAAHRWLLLVYGEDIIPFVPGL